jgi:hypothetical protein
MVSSNHTTTLVNATIAMPCRLRKQDMEKVKKMSPYGLDPVDICI